MLFHHVGKAFNSLWIDGFLSQLISPYRFPLVSKRVTWLRFHNLPVVHANCLLIDGLHMFLCFDEYVYGWDFSGNILGFRRVDLWLIR